MMFWQHYRCKEILKSWADDNGYEILSFGALLVLERAVFLLVIRRDKRSITVTVRHDEMVEYGTAGSVVGLGSWAFWSNRAFEVRWDN